MFEHIENLQYVDIVQGISSVRRRYFDRSDHALIFKLSGCSRYTMDNGSFLLAPGGVLYIPQGASYLVEQIEPGQYLAVRFAATLQEPARLFSIGDRVDYGHLCRRLQTRRAAVMAADRYWCLSIFYEIAAYLCREEADDPGAAVRRRIEPALAYLHEHLFDPDLRIGRLHERCGMSDTYFRRIFRAEFGVTPKAYLQTKRLIQAKSILDSGEYNSIAEAALLTGFDDPLYFSKVFKRAYGYAPSKG